MIYTFIIYSHKYLILQWNHNNNPYFACCISYIITYWFYYLRCTYWLLLHSLVFIISTFKILFSISLVRQRCFNRCFIVLCITAVIILMLLDNTHHFLFWKSLVKCEICSIYNNQNSIVTKQYSDKTYFEWYIVVIGDLQSAYI